VPRRADARARAGAAAELKLSVAVAPAFPLGAAAKAWGEALAAAPDGAVASKLHPGASLAQRDPAREFLALRDGAADLAVGSALAWSAQLPALAIYALPWLAPEREDLAALVASTEVAGELMKRAEAQGVVIVALAPLGHRALATTGKVVRAPADLAGLRVRATGGPLVVETLASLGARPEAMGFAQAQDALAAGTLDAQDGLATSFVAARLPATGYRQLVRWGAFGDAMVFAVRRAVWDGFTDAQRRAAVETARRSPPSPGAAREDEAAQVLVSLGMGETRLTRAGHDAFAQARPACARRGRRRSGPTWWRPRSASSRRHARSVRLPRRDDRRDRRRRQRHRARRRRARRGAGERLARRPGRRAVRLARRRARGDLQRRGARARRRRHRRRRRARRRGAGRRRGRARSSRIADGADTLARGIVSFANARAASLGVAPGMSCRDAAERLRAAPMPTGTLSLGRDARSCSTPADAHATRSSGSIRSAACATTTAARSWSSGRTARCTAGVASSALPVDAAGAFFHDAGGGRDGAGYTRLPALDARGIPAATVAHTSARIGDARSMWATGTLSRVNRAAEARGLSTGMRVADAARALARRALATKR
jgi:TRAP-type C4-dicarboxylate transport system substrate-binding protein